MNRPDLIAQLEKLTPTEGEWDDSYGIIEANDVALFDRRSATTDDCTLITLAPAMRIEILAMAKEIEELKNEVEELEYALSQYIKM
jgi:hypothetical protein